MLALALASATPVVAQVQPRSRTAMGHEGLDRQVDSSDLRESELVQSPRGRAATGQKGTLLIFPHVEARYDSNLEVVSDTFIQLSNDLATDVHVLAFFVADDCVRHHVDFDLTKEQPVYWSVENGLPLGVAPLSAFHTPQVDPLTGESVIRGALLVFAADNAGRAIRWNHLHGLATVVSYARSNAWEYAPYAFQALEGSNGDLLVPPGELHLDGIQLQAPPNRLLLEFTAYKSTAYSNAGRMIQNDGLLTLFPPDVDLRQDWSGPARTKAKFEVWNGEEISMAAERCVTCWASVRLSQLGGVFLIENLATNHGRARIDGVASVLCPESAERALLGVAAKVLEFDSGQISLTGSTLIGTGQQSALIRYDIPPPPEESLPPPELP